MNGYEQLGLFYLGRRYDLDTHTRLSEPILYDSKDLVTHAMCVGMTGSGKTGLGITLIEEAAIDGVPVLAIDPKGDLANLLLTFPRLDSSEFLPWIDPAEAAARKLSAEDYAAAEAGRWRAGLAEWDQTPERIAMLRAAAPVRLYTPGSRAATPLAILNGIGAMSEDDDADARAAALSSTAASLLALVGYDAAEQHSREQALIAAILGQAGAAVTPAGQSRGADLGWLVQQVQRPSFDRVGVLDLETFYPARERQELALRFNSVLASPGFDVWLTGDPLDPASLLFTPEGKPRVAIVSIAHLDDTRRMLVVSLLLNAVLQWTRRQRGTGSLRALIYMDEVFGYLPPVANPPSKLPLLTLLKQGRAFGVGITLATQNPVDLDYKALSNIGTWFLGKLQTERDKTRVLDGLEGAGGGMERAMLDRTLSALRSRVFLMHNVNEPAPVLFETRWTLSYLRGPLGRDELRRLAANKSHPSTAARGALSEVEGQNPNPNAQITTPAPASGQAESPKPRAESLTTKPVLPAGIREVFFDAKDGDAATFEPVLYGAARVHYTDSRRGIDVTQDVIATVPFSDGAVAVDWDRAEPETELPEQLATSSPSVATEFTRPPADALNPKRYAEWSRDFEQWIVRARPLTLYAVRSLKLTSRPGESERDFRIRLQQAMREARDAQVEKLRAKYAARVERVTAKVRQAEEALGREQQQAQQQKVQTAVSFGATLLGAVLGRRAVSLSTLGRATTAARGVSRTAKEVEDVTRAQDRVESAQAELAQLQEQINREVESLTAGDAVDVETVPVKAKRGSIDVRLIALAWTPTRRRSATSATP